jgi:hypothetical protein
MVSSRNLDLQALHAANNKFEVLDPSPLVLSSFAVVRDTVPKIAIQFACPRQNGAVFADDPLDLTQLLVAVMSRILL